MILKHKKGDIVTLPISSNVQIKVQTPIGFEDYETKQTIEFKGNLLKFTLENGLSLTTTPDHIHTLSGDGLDFIFKKAGDVKVGDVMFDIDHNPIKVVNIEEVPYDGLVYDYTVPNHHLFFANNILTHNCCRLRLDLRELRTKNGGLFGSGDNTGSIGVVTLNFPRMGYVAKDEDEFYAILDKYLEIAKDALESKRKFITEQFEAGLYPYTKRYIGSYNNFFSTIGVIGMHECCLNLLGKGIDTEEGSKFVVECFQYIKRRLQDFQEETGNLYNLEGIPGESTCYRLAKHDKEKYPDIITAGTKDEKSKCFVVDLTAEV